MTLTSNILNVDSLILNFFPWLLVASTLNMQFVFKDLLSRAGFRNLRVDWTHFLFNILISSPRQGTGSLRVLVLIADGEGLCHIIKSKVTLFIQSIFILSTKLGWVQTLISFIISHHYIVFIWRMMDSTSVSVDSKHSFFVPLSLRVGPTSFSIAIFSFNMSIKR